MENLAKLWSSQATNCGGVFPRPSASSTSKEMKLCVYRTGCLTGNGEKLSSTQAELTSISCATSYLVTQYLSFEEDMFASSIPPVSCHHRAFAFLRILEKTGMAIIPLPNLAPRAPQPRLPITESVVASMCRADETITITHAHVPLASLLNMNDNLTKVPPKQQLGNSNV